MSKIVRNFALAKRKQLLSEAVKIKKISSDF